MNNSHLKEFLCEDRKNHVCHLDFHNADNYMTKNRKNMSKKYKKDSFRKTRYERGNPSPENDFGEKNLYYKVERR